MWKCKYWFSPISGPCWAYVRPRTVCEFGAVAVDLAMASSFPVGLLPWRKLPQKKNAQKGTPPGGEGGGSFLSVFASMPSQQENYKQWLFMAEAIETLFGPCARAALLPCRFRIKVRYAISLYPCLLRPALVFAVPKNAMYVWCGILMRCFCVHACFRFQRWMLWQCFTHMSVSQVVYMLFFKQWNVRLPFGGR